jgi:hypothetical protein
VLGLALTTVGVGTAAAHVSVTAGRTVTGPIAELTF